MTMPRWMRFCCCSARQRIERIDRRLAERRQRHVQRLEQRRLVDADRERILMQRRLHRLAVERRREAEEIVRVFVGHRRP